MWSGADASYLAAITAAGRKYTWRGTLTDANGTTYSFDAEDIVKGSGQISKMVSSDTSLDIGTVYTSELTIRLYLAVNRYVLFGGTIDLYCDVDVNGSTYSVPMGEFIIASCTQEMACISITAYDAMTKLDSVNVVQDLGASTPFAWISFILSRAGLTLGTAQADIEAMPNGTELLTFTNCNTDLASMTCRDALAYLCMILCANAYVGRDGKVYVQQYSMTAADDIAANERFSSSFSDFTTNYTSVTLGVHATGTAEYYAQPTDDGLNYDLGANPWMQAGSAADREAMCRAILADLNGISYEPYTVSIPIRPELDPMDVLTFSGNQASTDKGAVTSAVYKLGGAMTIKCSGENPRLAGAKSKTQKSLEALSSTVAKEINQMSVVQNSSAVTCGENTETSILTYNFEVTQEENTTMVDVSVVMTSSASETEVGDVYTLSDIVAHLSFYVDGSEINVYAPEFIVDEGKDTMTFNYSLSGLSVGAHEFDVRLEMDGGSGSVAVGDVHEILWGYGITFEVYVKKIDVTQMPAKTTYYIGQRLDFTGIEVRQIYNNGKTEDVTSDCTFDPADGTEMTEYDVGTLSVQTDYEDFSTTFDLTVRELAYKYIIGNTEMFNSTNNYTSGKSGCRFASYDGALYCITWYMVDEYSDFNYRITKIDPNVQNDDITVLASYSGTMTRTSSYYFKGGFVIGEDWYVFETRGLAYLPKAYRINLRLGTVTEMTLTHTYAPDPTWVLSKGWVASRIYSVGNKILIGDMTVVIEKASVTQQVQTVAYGEVNGNTINITITGETGDFDSGSGTSIYCSEKNVVLSAPLKYKKLISTENNCCYVYEISLEDGYEKRLVGTYDKAGWEMTGFFALNDLDIVAFWHLPMGEGLSGGYLDCNSGEETEFTQTMLRAFTEGNPCWDAEKEFFFLAYGTDIMRSTDLDHWEVVDEISSETGTTSFGTRYCFNGSIWVAGYNSVYESGTRTYHYYPTVYAFEGA